jgi:regulator of protease activity HflC (stomatin/prohibitin superfamily)
MTALDETAGFRAQAEAAAGPLPFGVAREALRLVRRIACGVMLAAAGLIIALSISVFMPSVPVLQLLRRTGLATLPLAALLAALAGLVGTWIMAQARERAVAPVRIPAARRWRFPSFIAPTGGSLLVGRAARWPQAIAVTSIAVLACAAGLLLPPDPSAVVPASFLLGLSGGAIVAAFPFLVAERSLAAIPHAQFPEAASLRALMFLVVLALTVTGLLGIAAGLGLPFVARIGRYLVIVPVAVASELALRALGRLFLPPPDADEARAVADSIVARMLLEGASARSVAGPLRQHFGIDLSRSWALSYIASAAAPVALLLVLLCWLLSGIVIVGLDQRGIYERFGAPVAVLGPGLHVMLPWPLGQMRRVEYGVIHEISLAQRSEATVVERVGAEESPPSSADRLWEQAHPDEVTFLIASDSGGRQNFQIVSADIRVLYRIGAADEDALHAAYSTADPVSILRSAAGRVAAGFFAGKTLDAVLGENREAMADELRIALQLVLDRDDCGLTLEAVVIEAIHPPTGAAEAYHRVQAAQIEAEASVSAEHGRAFATLSGTQQYAFTLVTQSAATAAETTGAATGELTRFTADRTAAVAGGRSFLFERYLANLVTGLGSIAALTIVDHRIPAAGAPVFDLRASSAASAPNAAPGLE